jgi:hypothetical protein
MQAELLLQTEEVLLRKLRGDLHFPMLVAMMNWLLPLSQRQSPAQRMRNPKKHNLQVALGVNSDVWLFLGTIPGSTHAATPAATLEHGMPHEAAICCPPAAVARNHRRRPEWQHWRG